MSKDKTTVKHSQDNQNDVTELRHNSDETFENKLEILLIDLMDESCFKLVEPYSDMRDSKIAANCMNDVPVKRILKLVTAKHQAEIAECRNGMMLLPIVKEKDKRIKELTAENDTNKKMLLTLKEANKDMRSFEDVLTLGIQEKKIAELEAENKIDNLIVNISELEEANKDMRSFEDVLTIGFQERKIAELKKELEWLS